MKTFDWTNIGLPLILIATIVLFSFTNERNSKRKIKKAVISFVGEDTLFISKEKVNKLLIENREGFLRIGKEKLALNRIEHKLTSDSFIEKAEVFITVDGILKTFVKQKTPIARFFGEETSYYIDRQKTKMPLSERFTARVPIVFGKLDELDKDNLSSIEDLLLSIYEDEFLRKNIIGIEILSDNTLKMRCRNYDFNIYFGALINCKTKLDKYKAFYQNTVLSNSLEKYRAIDLRFETQVVCIK